MPARVMHLLDDLEARLAKARTQLAVLREDNRRLKRRLAELLAAERSAPIDSDALSATAFVSAATSLPAVTPLFSGDAKMPDHSSPAAPERETSVSAEQTSATAPETPPTPQALLKQWQTRYPRAFAGAEARPLKVGIHHDLAAREPWSTKLIRRALAGYVNRPRYVKALKEGATRIDLDGNPAGTVDATAAQTAQEKYRRKAASKARPEARKKKPADKPGRSPKTGAASGAGKKAATGAPADSEAAKRPAQQSMEDKLASLQRRFGGQE